MKKIFLTILFTTLSAAAFTNVDWGTCENLTYNASVVRCRDGNSYVYYIRPSGTAQYYSEENMKTIIQDIAEGQTDKYSQNIIARISNDKNLQSYFFKIQDDRNKKLRQALDGTDKTIEMLQEAGGNVFDNVEQGLAAKNNDEPFDDHAGDGPNDRKNPADIVAGRDRNLPAFDKQKVQGMIASASRQAVNQYAPAPDNTIPTEIFTAPAAVTPAVAKANTNMGFDDETVVLSRRVSQNGAFQTVETKYKIIKRGTDTRSTLQKLEDDFMANAGNDNSGQMQMDPDLLLGVDGQVPLAKKQAYNSGQALVRQRDESLANRSEEEKKKEAQKIAADDWKKLPWYAQIFAEKSDLASEMYLAIESTVQTMKEMESKGVLPKDFAGFIITASKNVPWFRPIGDAVYNAGPTSSSVLRAFVVRAVTERFPEYAADIVVISDYTGDNIFYLAPAGKRQPVMDMEKNQVVDLSNKKQGDIFMAQLNALDTPDKLRSFLIAPDCRGGRPCSKEYALQAISLDSKNLLAWSVYSDILKNEAAKLSGDKKDDANKKLLRTYAAIANIKVDNVYGRGGKKYTDNMAFPSVADGGAVQQNDDVFRTYAAAYAVAEASPADAIAIADTLLNISRSYTRTLDGFSREQLYLLRGNANFDLKEYDKALGDYNEYMKKKMVYDKEKGIAEENMRVARIILDRKEKNDIFGSVVLADALLTVDGSLNPEIADYKRAFKALNEWAVKDRRIVNTNLQTDWLKQNYRFQDPNSVLKTINKS